MPKIIKNKKKPKYIYDYENNGYAVIKNVFGSEIIGNINGHVSWLRKKPKDSSRIISPSFINQRSFHPLFTKPKRTIGYC